MNQEQNNLNPNNFNAQGNNGIPNNQPLNNQSFNQGMGFNQQPINPQPQPTNTFESGNASNQNFKSRPPKKMNLGLIIGIVATVVVVGVGIVFGSKLLSNGNNGDENNSNSSEESIKPPLNEDNTIKEDNESKLVLDGIAYVGSRKITINYDAGPRRKETKSDSIVFPSKMSNIIALTYDKSSTYNGNINEVFNLLNDGDLFNDISTYLGTAFEHNKIYKIEINSSEHKKINNFDSVLIDGYVMDSNNKKALVYGYTFIIDSTPCMLIGIVIDSTTNEELVNFVKLEIDEMAKTIREE